MVATNESAGGQAAREGSDLVIDYRTHHFTTLVRDYDLALESLGGQALENSLQAVASGGLVIRIAGPPDPDFARQLGRPLLRSVLALLAGKIRSLARRRNISYSFLFMGRRRDAAEPDHRSRRRRRNTPGP